MGWLRQIFGSGVIICDFRLADGRDGTAKIPYEGDISTLDMDEIKREIQVKAGQKLAFISVKDVLER